MDAPLAGWWIRCGAYIIDWLVLIVPGALLFLLFRLFAFIPDLGIFFAYSLLMTRKSQYNGQSLGMQAVGIRVRCEDGRPVDVQVVVMRELLMKGIVFGLGAILIVPFLLDYLWPLWDSENRALHDIAAKTRVVRAT